MLIFCKLVAKTITVIKQRSDDAGYIPGHRRSATIDYTTIGNTGLSRVGVWDLYLEHHRCEITGHEVTATYQPDVKYEGKYKGLCTCFLEFVEACLGS